jgi:hypothetical protein
LKGKWSYFATSKINTVWPLGEEWCFEMDRKRNTMNLLVCMPNIYIASRKFTENTEGKSNI